MNRYKIVLAAMLLSVGVVYAQNSEETGNKTRKTIELPKAGDIGLGIDVVPVFKYVGNMFNGATNNGLNSFGGEYALPDVSLDNDAVLNQPTVSIMGKYMITDNIAARLNVGVLTVHQNEQKYSVDDAALALNPLSEAEVIDQKIVNQTGAAFSLGAEYRRGYKWIQGFGGLNLMYAFSEKNIHYNYGNAITELNQMPTRSWTGDPVNQPGNWSSAYVLDYFNQGSDQYCGIGAHVGVEVFLASYLSIGGEVSLNAIWKFGAPEYQVTEGFNTSTNIVEQRTETITPGNNAFVFGTQNLGAKLYMMFYF